MKYNPLVACLLAVAFVLTGCNKPTPDQIVKGIDALAPTLVLEALNEAAVKAPDSTKKDAALISLVIHTDVQPYLNTAAGLPAPIVVRQVKDLLAKKINPQYLLPIATVIGLATFNIDLTAPAMTANELNYTTHSINAIAAGCDAFVAGKKAAALYDVHKAHMEDQAAITIDPIPSPTYSYLAAPAEIVDLDEELVLTAPIIKSEPTHVRIGHMWVRTDHTVKVEQPRVVRKKIAPAKAVPCAVATPAAVWDNIKVTKIDPHFSGIIVYSCPAWCDPCLRMEPILAALIADGCAIHRIDGDANKELMVSQEVEKVPAYVRYRNGVEQDRHYGSATREEMLSWLGTDAR